MNKNSNIFSKFKSKNLFYKEFSYFKNFKYLLINKINFIEGYLKYEIIKVCKCLFKNELISKNFSLFKLI